MTAIDMTLLVDRARAEIVGHGVVPTPVLEESATQTVQLVWGRGGADTYITLRLTYVLNQLGQHLQSSGAIHDAQVALGEYETYLALQRKAAA